ncbi:hypothetical protein Dimus_015877, partial [Dionaea muscipula]
MATKITIGQSPAPTTLLLHLPSGTTPAPASASPWPSIAGGPGITTVEHADLLSSPLLYSSPDYHLQ